MQKETFARTLYDYAREYQWPRLMGWSEDELRAVPVHEEATSVCDYLNLANFGNTALGVTSVAGGGTSAHVHAIPNLYVYQDDTPPELYARLQRLLDAEGPPAHVPGTFGGADPGAC